MTDQEFDELVDQGIAAIPQKFLDLLDNVAIIVEERPTLEQRNKLNLDHGWDLFGLYEGISQNRRGPYYGGVLPDKITIFKGPIEAAAKTPQEVAQIVRDTVWHEIAHHFGMDEHEVRSAERKRRQKNDK
jgi:predicted Zn-dependent protease with MMP-like domain